MQTLPGYILYVLFCTDLKSLPRFIISLPRFEIPKAYPICNPCFPDLQSLKPAPICNPLIAPFCNPENFPDFVVLPPLVLESEHE